MEARLTVMEKSAWICGMVLETEPTLTNKQWMFKKKRQRAFKLNGNCLYQTMNMQITFDALHRDQTTLNQARIDLLDDEFSLFTNALLNHPIPFPTNYKQQWVNRGNESYIQLAARERPEDFAIRLASAIGVLRSEANNSCFFSSN